MPMVTGGRSDSLARASSSPLPDRRQHRLPLQGRSCARKRHDADAGRREGEEKEGGGERKGKCSWRAVERREGGRDGSWQQGPGRGEEE
eukprot:388809-Hanusia_phi.AAC.1